MDISTNLNKDPRQQLLERYSLREAQELAARLPDGMGFALLLFDFGQEKFLAYTSNADRDDMKKTLRELLDHLEGQ